jgi:CRP-like cAMP-binding protein
MQNYNKNQTVFKMGDEIKLVYFVNEGEVDVFNILNIND